MLKKLIKSLTIFFIIISLLTQNTVLVYAATFSAGMAKRDAPGTFAGALVVQNNLNYD